ncbi:MAG TPA: polysaccharide deacetylase family protein [Terriglobia bacterium]|nr:polysaccharide deacetylase family protein [Terriglobia bacterium]
MIWPAHVSSKETLLTQRLGYPADARLLIIHADDLGVAHSENSATLEALRSGAVSSASVMVPCPWLTEVADFARAHPEADIGVHLTLTSEWKTYRWGPCAPRNQVPSLLDSHGYFFASQEDAVRHMKPEEGVIEIRAQVEAALGMGIQPTHLDSHMATLYTRPELVAALARVAHEYHLPFLILQTPGAPPDTYAALHPNDVILDHVFMAEPPIRPHEWLSYYTEVLATLPPGVSQLIVHLAHDDAEMQAVTAGYSSYEGGWRQRDFNVVKSREFRQALKRNCIELITWRDLGKLPAES